MRAERWIKGAKLRMLQLWDSYFLGFLTGAYDASAVGLVLFGFLTGAYVRNSLFVSWFFHFRRWKLGMQMLRVFNLPGPISLWCEKWPRLGFSGFRV